MDGVSDALRRVRRAVVVRARGRLRARVVDVVESRVGAAAPLSSADLTALEAAVDRADAALTSAELQLAASRAALAPLDGPFLPSLTMAQVLRRHPNAVRVLATIGLPGCSGCSVRHDETLAEAIDGYGLDGPALVAELNALLPPRAEVPGLPAASG